MEFMLSSHFQVKFANFFCTARRPACVSITAHCDCDSAQVTGKHSTDEYWTRVTLSHSQDQGLHFCDNGHFSGIFTFYRQRAK